VIVVAAFMTPSLNLLVDLYFLKKKEITSRLKEFKKIGQLGDKRRIFAEMCFCILTPQSKAKSCWSAIEGLSKKDLLLKGQEKDISRVLNLCGVRFHNNKAKYIVSARKNFSELRRYDYPIPELRSWLVKNIKGIGLKEASHFLRNVGLGNSVAILDRHILKNLQQYDVIKEIPESMTSKKYMKIESKMIRFAKKINIPVSHLDLLFWSKETGEVFK